MPLRVRCPTGHKLILPDDRAGRTVRCPRCGLVTQVPAAEGADFRVQGSVERQPSEPAGVAERRRDSSADWPNSIAPPTMQPAAADLAVAAVAQEMLGPAPKPLPNAVRPSKPAVQPVVKPKSRALPPAPPATAAPPELPAPLVVAIPIAVEEVAHAAPLVESAPPVIAPIAPSPLEEASVAAPPVISVTPSVPASPWPAEREPLPLPPISAAAGQVAVVQAAAAPHVLAPEPEHRLSVYQLAAALVAAALFSVVPAIWDVVEYVQVPESQFVARWALVLMLLGVVQIAYALYLIQLPDWTSVWVVTVYSLFLAAIYAAVLGLVLISRDGGVVVGALQLADKLAGGKAVLWCLCMVGVSTILAFFAGRLSARWHKTEMFIRQSGLRPSGV